MSNKLRYELLIAGDCLVPGEVMSQELAGMSWEALICMICGGRSATLPLTTIVALKLAQKLDSLERP